jgi:hypothetical protein
MPLGAQIPNPHTHTTAQLEAEQYSHEDEFNAELNNQFNEHYSTFLSAGHLYILNKLHRMIISTHYRLQQWATQ